MDIFLKSLNQSHLKEYYIIKDTLRVLNHKTGESKVITDAFQKTININGKFIDLLEIFKKDSKIFHEYHYNLLGAGDLSYSHYLLVLKHCSDFNLDNKYHRLIIAITIFGSNKEYI